LLTPTMRSRPTARLSPDARLSLGLLCISLSALVLFLWFGFGPLPERHLLSGGSIDALRAHEAGTTFIDATETLGLSDFRHDTGGLHSIEDAVAPGLGLLDLDHDGDLDLVLLGGSGNPVGVSIFENRRIPWDDVRFVDRTDASGIRWSGDAQGVCAGDVDGDGDIDLFITALGPNLLLRNLLVESGKPLVFEEATEEAGLEGGVYHSLRREDAAPDAPDPVYEGPPEPRVAAIAHEVPEFSTSASFGDFDLDGDLDLYVANYVSYRPIHHDVRDPDRGEALPYLPRLYPAQRDRLYENVDRGRFRDVTEEMGLGGEADKGLGVMFARLDGNRYPDLIVANDVSPNRAWLNVADPSAIDPLPRRRFVEASIELGLHDTRSGMGIAHGDADDDGDLDLLITNWRDEPASLFLFSLAPAGSRFPVLFDEESQAFGIGEATDPLVGWGTVFFDYDNDGDSDCMVVNGGTSPATIDAPRCSQERALLFRNIGGRFADVSLAAGEPFARSYAARGLVCGDIDLDSDLDVVFTQNNGGVVALLNLLERTGTSSALSVSAQLHWELASGVAVRRGDAIGALVLVFMPDAIIRVQEIASGGSFLSQGPLSLHFGFGPHSTAQRVQIDWPLPQSGERIRTAIDNVSAQILNVHSVGRER